MKSGRSMTPDIGSFSRSGNPPRVGLLVSALSMGATALSYALRGTIQVDYGLDSNQTAQISVYRTLAADLGCVLGGLLRDRIGLRHGLAFGYLASTVPTIYLAMQISLNGLEAVPLFVFFACIIACSVFFGIGFGLCAAIFMGMTNPAIAATQFTAFMAMGDLAISLANCWQGIVAERVG